tara:strand:+ start:621 stop:806 length:186 start_codon:yes stop_codon:yes gene_type:complete
MAAQAVVGLIMLLLAGWELEAKVMTVGVVLMTLAAAVVVLEPLVVMAAVVVWPQQLLVALV